MRKDGAVLESSVLGILSLILWSLILIVTVKYVLVLTRADNRGVGGSLALMALAQRALGAGFLSDKEDPRILAARAMARPLDDREACACDLCLE